MKSLLQEIIERLAKVDLVNLLYQPTVKLEPEYEVLGVANDDAKKMYIVWQGAVEEHKNFCNNIISGIMGGSKNILEDEEVHENLHELIDLSEKFFWNEVEIQFKKSLKKDDVISIIEGWKVVLIKKIECDCDDVIMELFDEKDFVAIVKGIEISVFN